MINVVILVGRLTRDPEFQKAVSTGTSIAKFSLANSQWTKDGDKVSYINCVSFNRTAENVYNHVHKGDMVGVVGRLSTSQYTAKDGTKRTSTDVLVNEVQFIETRKQEVAPKTVEFAPKPEEKVDDFGMAGLGIDPEDLPF